MNCSFDEVKFEKAKAMLRYNRLHTLANLLRLAELAGALLVLSWCSTYLPLALRAVSAFFAAPLFFFLLCNAIILTLLANSGWLSRQLTASPPIADSYTYHKADTDLSVPDSEFQVPDAYPEIVYQDKEMIPEVPVLPSSNTDAGIEPIIEEREPDLEFPKTFRRTKSEIQYPEKSAIMPVVLRRSETGICREIVTDENLNTEEEMSNEEFQKTIEAFIAKQLKFRRQESTAGVIETYS